MKKSIPFFLLLSVLYACIGTDIVDGELVDEVIEVKPIEQGLIVGNSVALSAKYTDMFGNPSDATLEWVSKNNGVAIVNNAGNVTAIGRGQTIINAKRGKVMSNDVLITVVADEFEIAQIVVNSNEVTTIAPGQKVQLTAKAYNIEDSELQGKTIEWVSSDESIATVDTNGLVTGIKEGAVEVTAKSEGISSMPLSITVGFVSKTAPFSGVSGYTAEGTATIKVNEDENLILELSSDFKTSFALGTFIFLSNSTSGSATRSGGLEIQEIKTGGAKSFNISAIDAGVNIDTYRYVIILCKPASITFGSADFKN